MRMIMHYLNGRKVSFENERTDLDISKKLKATYNLESKKVPNPWSMVESFGMVGPESALNNLADSK
jgi:hypothetical protein